MQTSEKNDNTRKRSFQIVSFLAFKKLRAKQFQSNPKKCKIKEPTQRFKKFSVWMNLETHMKETAINSQSRYFHRESLNTGNISPCKNVKFHSNAFSWNKAIGASMSKLNSVLHLQECRTLFDSKNVNFYHKQIFTARRLLRS
jgi:hypothetical protein